MPRLLDFDSDRELPTNEYAHALDELETSLHLVGIAAMKPRGIVKVVRS